MTYRNLRYPVDLIQLLSAALHMSASCVDIGAVINEQLDSLCLYSPSSKQLQRSSVVSSQKIDINAIIKKSPKDRYVFLDCCDL